MSIRSLCIVTAFLSVHILSAQTEIYRADVGNVAFSKEKTFVSVGYGLMNANFILANTLEKSLLNGWDEVNFSKVPNWYIKGEYALSNHVGVGVNVATGGLIAHVFVDSLNNQSVRIAGDLTYRTWSALARFNYHALSNEKWDIYLGAGLGLRMNTVAVSSNDPLTDRWNFPVNLGFVEKRIPNKLSVPTIGADFTLGFAYHFSPAIAAYTEMGMAKSAMQAGIRAKF